MITSSLSRSKPCSRSRTLGGTDNRFSQVVQRPATSALIAVLALVWMHLHREGLSYAVVGMSYDLVCNQGQLWRAFSAQVQSMRRPGVCQKHERRVHFANHPTRRFPVCLAASASAGWSANAVAEHNRLAGCLTVQPR
jgi:hypothetical protein